MSWIDECINKLNTILDNCDVYYYEPEGRDRRTYISIVNNSNDSLYEHYDGIEEIANEYGLEIATNGDSFDLIDMADDED